MENKQEGNQNQPVEVTPEQAAAVKKSWKLQINKETIKLVIVIAITALVSVGVALAAKELSDKLQNCDGVFVDTTDIMNIPVEDMTTVVE